MALGAVAFWAASAIAGGPAALACTPIAIPSAEQDFRSTPVIFRGTVVEVRAVAATDAWPYDREARIAVEEVLKGVVAREVIIPHSSARSSCGGGELPVGREMTFRAGSPEVIPMGSALPRARLIGFADRSRLDAVLRRFRTDVAAAERRVAEHPAEIEPRVALASLLEEWGDMDQAGRVYDELAVLAPVDPRVLLGRARILFSRGRHLDSIALLSRVLAVSPRDADARFLLERARVLTGEIDVPAELDVAGLRLTNLGWDGASWYARPYLSARGRILSRSLLAQIQLERADLTDARLDGATIVGSFILGVDAERADLSGARIDHSVLASMSARRVRMVGARFHEVSMSGVFNHAVASGVQFESVRFEYAFMAGAHLDNARFARVTVSRGDFRGALLDAAEFRDTRFFRSDFSSASLRGATIRSTRFISAAFDRTDFHGADLAGTDFTSSTFANVSFAGARLGAATFRNTRMSRVDLSRAALDDVDLRAMRFGCDTQFPRGFDPARHGAIPLDASCGGRAYPRIFDGVDFSGEYPNQADFSDLDLSGASFRRANLAGARFHGATLREANFSESVGSDLHLAADLTGADFTDARDLRGLFGYEDRPAPSIEGAIFRGATFSSYAFIGYSEEYVPADVGRARMEGATLTCERLAQSERNAEFDRQINWIRWLDPRRRGIAIADSCRSIPQLRGVW